MHNHSVVADDRMSVQNRIYYNGRYSSMEDGRVIAVNNHTVAVVYSGKFAKFEQNFKGERYDLQILVYGIYNSDLGYVEFGKHEHTQAQWLKYPGDQKNWVPFVHNSRIYLYQSINPVHIVKVSKHSNDSSGTSSSTDSSTAIAASITSAEGDSPNMIATVKTFVKEDVPLSLPWNGTEYGQHIKGGTPAIMVRGVLLSFFHTQLSFVKQWRTYFMGAITYCPHHPFQIHTMSPVPIVMKSLYDGPWANKFCNYVIFPMGIVLDDDNRHVWLSLGYQDRHGYTVKMSIDGLFESMDLVSNCSASSHSITGIAAASSVRLRKRA